MNRYNFIQFFLCLMMVQTECAYKRRGRGTAKCGKQVIQPTFITPTCPSQDIMRKNGGCDSKPFSWPWAIQLRNNMSLDGSLRHQCVATLISSSFAVAVTHCFLFVPDASRWTAVAGRHERDVQGSNEQIRQISKIIALPNPTGNNLDRDLSLIKFNKPMELNNYVSPICLPHREPKVGDDCTVIGWDTKKDHEKKDVLKQTLLPIIDRDVCNKTEGFKNGISEYMVCAGWTPGKNDACQGESGSPLMCKINGAYYLEGISSWGIDCAATGVYTNVHKTVNWIRNQMTKN